MEDQVMSESQNEIHSLLLEMSENNKKLFRVCRRMIRRYKNMKLTILEHNIDYDALHSLEKR